MPDDRSIAPDGQEKLDREIETRPFRLSAEERARFHSEFETVKGNEGSPPIYGYIGAAAIIGLFFAKVFETGTKDNITYILAALAVVNALIISSFSYTSLQIQELKQFQTAHSDPNGAENEWEFNWRRSEEKSVTLPVKNWYYGVLYSFLGVVSLFLVAASFASIHHWWEGWAGTLAIIVHLLPFKIIRQELRVAQKKWDLIRTDLEKRRNETSAPGCQNAFDQSDT